MRIGILKTDSVRDEFRAAHGDYPQMFERRLSEAAAQLGLPIEFAVYDVTAGEYPGDPRDCDAYVITGSRNSVYEPEGWIAHLADFVRRLHAERRKLIGICFGHQLIAQALGGETRAAPNGWAVGAHCTRVVARKPWMQPSIDRYTLLSSHRDQVVSLPPGAELIATTEFCPISAFTVGEHFLALQGHPEFEAPYSRALIDFRGEVLGAERHGAGIASLADPLDQASVAEWMLRFIATGRQMDEAVREHGTAGNAGNAGIEPPASPR